jgi:hypothetical protein
MYADESMAMDESSALPAVRQASIAPAPPAGSTSQELGNEQPGGAAPAQKSKRSMKITHDKFIQLQGLIIMHLSAHEEATGRGMDKDELIDWYLESKEEEMEDVDQLEYERELITKMLRKLVKVSFDFFPVGRMISDLYPRTTISLRSRVTSRNRCPQRPHNPPQPSEVMRTSEHITWSTHPWTLKSHPWLPASDASLLPIYVLLSCCSVLVL